MFRAEILWFADGPTLKMKGSLVRDWAEHARSLVTGQVVPEGLIIDLSEVSYIDSAGEQLLKWLGSLGVEFVANTIYAADVCERLELPLLENIRAGPYAAALKSGQKPHTMFRTATRRSTRASLLSTHGLAGKGSDELS